MSGALPARSTQLELKLTAGLILIRNDVLSVIFALGVCPVNCIARIDRDMTLDEIVEAVKKDMLYYRVSGGGVTISGGEPFQQKKAAIALLKKLKESHISTCVETCLYCEFDALEQAIPYVDQFFVDLKFMDSEDHKRYIGKPNDLILENFKKLAGRHPHITVRVPLAPGITDTEKEHQSGYGICAFNRPEYSD